MSDLHGKYDYKSYSVSPMKSATKSFIVFVTIFYFYEKGEIWIRNK